MAQIDPKDMDSSPIMREFFDRVVANLIDRNITPDEAEQRVAKFFGRQVSPLERAIVMHRGVERITNELL